MRKAIVNNDDHFLTVAQAAKKLGCSGRLLRRYCEQGRLGRRVGASWVLTVEEVQSFVLPSRLSDVLLRHEHRLRVIEQRNVIVVPEDDKWEPANDTP